MEYIQIIPATNWVAVWEKGNETWIDHIPCFGLTRAGYIHALSINQNGRIVTYDSIISKLPDDIKVTIMNRNQSVTHFAKINQYNNCETTRDGNRKAEDTGNQ